MTGEINQKQYEGKIFLLRGYEMEGKNKQFVMLMLLAGVLVIGLIVILLVKGGGAPKKKQKNKGRS